MQRAFSALHFAAPGDAGRRQPLEGHGLDATYLLDYATTFDICTNFQEVEAMLKSQAAEPGDIGNAIYREPARAAYEKFHNRGSQRRIDFAASIAGRRLSRRYTYG